MFFAKRAKNSTFWVPLIIALAFFMESVDTTIMNTSIPLIAKEFGVHPLDLKMALLSYLLSLAMFIPVSGWFADKFGIKKIFFSAISLFTLSSFLCGFANHLTELAIARLFQGIGGAFMVPVGRLIVLRIFEKSNVVVVMNRIILVALMGPMLGPILGGFISHVFSWRWIFWVNIPLGLITLGLVGLFLSEYTMPAVRPLDKTGFLLFGLGLGSLIVGLAAFSEEALTVSIGWLMMACSVVLFSAYWRYSRVKKNAIFDLALLTAPTFRFAICGNFAIRVSFGAMPFLLPLFLQLVLHYSPIHAGLITALLALGGFLMKFFSKALLKKIGFKKTLMGNVLALSMSIALLSMIQVTTAWQVIAIEVLLLGVLLSLQYSAMNPLYFSDIDSVYFAQATSIQSIIMQATQSISVAIYVLILKTNQHNFQQVFLIMGIMTLFSLSVFCRLKKDVGHDLL